MLGLWNFFSQKEQCVSSVFPLFLIINVSYFIIILVYDYEAVFCNFQHDIIIEENNEHQQDNLPCCFDGTYANTGMLVLHHGICCRKHAILHNSMWWNFFVCVLYFKWAIEVHHYAATEIVKAAIAGVATQHHYRCLL